MSDDKFEPRVVSYGSFEEMMAEQQKKEEEANQRVLAIQREITYGSYALRPYETKEGILPILCKVPTIEEFLEDEGYDENNPEDMEEKEYALQSLKQRYERGYRFAYCSSIIEPGEWGDFHISTAFPITKEEYEFAAAHDWHISPETWTRVMNLVLEAIREQGESIG